MASLAAHQNSGTFPASPLPNAQEPPADDAATAAGQAPNPFRKPYTIIGLFMTAVFAGLLVLQQMTFKDTWADKEDHSLKIWATVWLSAVVAKAAFHSYINVMALWLPQLRPTRGCIALLQVLLDIFLFCWTLYGIPAIFIYPKGIYPEEATKKWCYAGFIYQCILIFLPCVLAILCIPVLLCLMRSPRIREALLPFFVGPAPPPPTNMQPTPPDVLAQIRKAKFAEIIAERTELGESVDERDSAVGDRDARAARSLVAAAFPGNLSSAVSQIFTRMSSTQGGGAGAEGQPLARQGSSSGQPPPVAPVVAEAQSAAPRRTPSVRLPSCPICFLEFEPEDEVLCLPCDEIRHIYHSDCLGEWLGKSQHCPMCRANIVDLVRNKNSNSSATHASGSGHHGHGAPDTQTGESPHTRTASAQNQGAQFPHSQVSIDYIEVSSPEFVKPIAMSLLSSGSLELQRAVRTPSPTSCPVIAETAAECKEPQNAGVANAPSVRQNGVSVSSSSSSSSPAASASDDYSSI